MTSVRRPAARRRRELAEVAAVHFHRRGFHRVTIGGVAAEVGVTAPAVYRHFANKNALLAGAIDTGLDEIEAALRGAAGDGGGLDRVLDHLTTAALRRPDFWTLIQREMRHLDDADRQRAVAQFRSLVAEVAGALDRHRHDPDRGGRDVLVTATMAVLATPSTYDTTVPAERLAPILTSAARAVCSADLPRPDPTAPGPGAVQEPPDRAGQILDTATALFHEHGYAAVSLDDIGAAVGIAGPSIYHHHPSKADLLVAAYDRMHARLPVVSADTAPAQALADYIDLARREREVVGTCSTETIHLPPDAATRVGRAAAADLARWSAMLRRDRPELDEPAAALLVRAARAAVHDVVRFGRLHRRPGLAGELHAVTAAVLAAAVPPAAW